jgi:hypothetical protein
MDWLAPIERLIYQFSWARLLRIAFLFAVIIAILVLYENYTGYLTLARVEKSIALLNAIHDMDSKGVSNDPELAKIRNNLVAQLADSVTRRPAPSIPSWSPQPRWSLKFFCAFFPWLVFILRDGARYMKVERSEKPEWAKRVWFHIIVGSLYSLVVALVPTIWWPWFNLIILPLFPLVLILLLSSASYAFADS